MQVTRTIRALATSGFAAIFTASIALAGNVIHVPADYATIQAAIEAAANGDEIIVAPGTYHEAINFLGKAITVKSSGGRDVTTIDATFIPAPIAVATFASGEGPDSILDGFRIRGGKGGPIQFPYGDNAGGGVQVIQSSPTIRNCTITANQATFGGGIAAVFDSDPTIQNCHIVQNTSTMGGGMAVTIGTASRLIDCLVEQNVALLGGGLLVVSSAAVGGTHIDDTVFKNNTSTGDQGGAVNVNGNGLALFKNCIFVGNSGTGVFILGSPNLFGAAEFVNCHFEGHTGASNAAISMGGPTAVVGCTFIGNSRAILGGSVAGTSYPMSVSASHFENHTHGAVRLPGGGLNTITNSVFLNNTASATSPVSAGAVTVPSGSGTTVISGCTFIGNKTAWTLGGGAIHHQGGSSLQIADSVFAVNSASAGPGGAVSALSGVVIQGSTFENNSAHSGGAVSVGGGGSLERSIENSTFKNNTATSDLGGGGAIVKTGGTTLTIANTAISGNSAVGTGGGIRHEGGTLTVINSTVTGNTAASGGGATITSATGALELQQTLFCENDPEHIEGIWTDLGGNSFHDECPECGFADLNCDGSVGVADLLILLAAWGKCADCAPAPGACPADLDGDCNVGVSDLLLLLANWG